jgi:SAM-dependent methyltransferase
VPGDRLAAACGADADALRRILRGLGALGIIADTPDGYALTPLGDLLRRDVPGSVYHPARLMGHPAVQRAWTSLPYTARTGRTAFDHAHGVDFFTYLHRDPDLADRFNRFMSGVTDEVAGTVAAHYDFGDAKRIVDVGGGDGALLRAVLRANPRAYGTVLDVTMLRRQAEEAIAADGLTDRCAFADGDFFASVPGGADVYLLKSVLHDWDDDSAVRILETCRAAMAPHSRLLVVERGIPDSGPAPFEDVMSDLIMLAMARGRERTGTEYRTLLGRAGLRPHAATPTPGGPTIFEALL